MKKILIALGLLISIVGTAQFNPSAHIVINDALGQNQSAPIEGRGMFWDATNFKWRDFQSTAEVISTLPTNATRFSHFPIYVHSGGTLSGGVWTGGITLVYFFKDGLVNSNLVRWYTDSVIVRAAQDSMWRVNDSTIAFTINGGPTRTLLVRGTAAGGISSLAMTAPSLFNSPVTFSNTAGAWTGALSFAPQNPAFFLAGPTTGGAATPTLRQIATSDLPTGIPNANLANSLINLGTGTSGTSPNWSSSSVSLGGTATYNMPTVSGTNTGVANPTLFNFWNAKVDSTIESNDSIYESRNGSLFFRYIISASGSGITSLNGLTGSTQTFAIGGAGLSPNFSSSGTIHTLNFPASSSSSVTLGGISNTEYNTFNNKLTSSLTSGNIFVGNGSNVATSVTPSGGVSVSNTGVFTLIGPSGISLPNLSWASNISGGTAKAIDTSYYRIFNVLDFGAKGDSTTDDRAAIVATIAAIPSSGGVLFFPAGKYRVSDSIYINKSIRIFGVNNVTGSTFLGNRSGGSVIYGGANDKPVFVFDQDGSGNKPVIGIDHLAIISNKATTPVDGSAGIVIRGFLQQPYITYCTIVGFYRDVDIQSAFYFTISNNWIGSSISSAIRINDLDRTDTGDWGIFDNQIISGNFTGTSKGIEWHSGGGLKIWGNKFDAQSFTQTTQFTYPIWISNDVDPTSDVQIFGNSIEDYQITAIYDSCKNNSTATIAHHIITGNQIAGVGSVGPGVAIINASFVQMSDNNIKDWIASAATGMQLTNCNRVQVENTYVVNFATAFINSGSTIDRMDVTLSNDTHTVNSSFFGINGDVAIGAGSDAIDSGFSYLHLPGSSTARASLIMASAVAPTTLKKGMFYNDGAAPWYVDDAFVAHNLLSSAVPPGNVGDVIFKATSTTFGASNGFSWDNIGDVLHIDNSVINTNLKVGVTHQLDVLPDFVGQGDLPANSVVMSATTGGLWLDGNDASGAAGDKVGAVYYNGITLKSAWEVANVASGTSNLLLMKGGGTVDIGTSSPVASAVFNVNSTTQGALLPRMNTSQQNAISSPATGLTIYNTDSLGLVDYSGSAWLKERTSGGASGVTTIGTFSSSSIVNGASISGSTLTLGVGDVTNPGMVSTVAQTFAGVKTHNTTSITSGGFYNSVPGSQILGSAATINNAVTSASGTVTNFSNYAFLAPTITSTNASITYNNPATLRIDNAPTMSTNSTATGRLYALDVAAGISHFGPGSSNISGIFDGTVSVHGGTVSGAYNFSIGASTTANQAVNFDAGVDPTTPTVGGAWFNGTNFYLVDGGTIKRDLLNGIHNYLHSVFTPTTGGTVNLVNNQYNIVNPAAALLAVTLNLPSSPNNNDVVYIKFTQTVSTVTYANGTVVDGITAPTAGGLVILTYDTTSTSWY